MKARAVIALLLGLAACAPTGGGPSTTAIASAGGGRQCFPLRNVNGFSPVDRDTINVDVGANDVYQVKVFGICQDLDWNQAVGLVARTGSSFICDAMDVTVISPSAIGPQRCTVDHIRKLSEAEVQALKHPHRPAG